MAVRAVGKAREKVNNEPKHENAIEVRSNVHLFYGKVKKNDLFLSYCFILTANCFLFLPRCCLLVSWDFQHEHACAALDIAFFSKNTKKRTKCPISKRQPKY